MWMSGVQNNINKMEKLRKKMQENKVMMNEKIVN